MNTSLFAALAAYVPRDRVEWLIRPEEKLPLDGVVLFADISGFTPLTEALTHGLSSDQGGEEVTRVLNDLFTPLIAQIETFHGSVVKFGGDSLMVWYGRQSRMRRSTVIRRAITSAWWMQQVMKNYGQVSTPIGSIRLSMKVGLAYGAVKRFHLGQPEYGYQDILGGRTVNLVAEAEYRAEPGEIVLDAATLAYLPNALTIAEWRGDFAVVDKLLRPAQPYPWSPLDWPPALMETLISRLAAYVAPSIYQTLATGHTQVAQLKPVVSLTLSHCTTVLMGSWHKYQK